MIERRYRSQLKRTLELLDHDPQVCRQRQRVPSSIDVHTALPKVWSQVTEARKALAVEYITHLTDHDSDNTRASKGLGNRLWLLFYKEIEALQSKLRTPASGDGEGEGAEMRALWKKRLEAVMLEGASVLTEALQNVRKASSNGVDVHGEDSVALMVALGDLARYAGRMMDAARDGERTQKCLEEAEEWYVQAAKTRPGFGRTYNQLAIVCTLKSRRVGEGEVLTAAFEYTRAFLAATEPFPAQENLIALLDRWRRLHESALNAATKAKSLAWLRQSTSRQKGGGHGKGDPTSTLSPDKVFLHALLKTLHMIYNRVDLDAVPACAHQVGQALVTLAQGLATPSRKKKKESDRGAEIVAQTLDRQNLGTGAHPLSSPALGSEEPAVWSGTKGLGPGVHASEPHAMGTLCARVVVVVTGALWTRAEAAGLFLRGREVDDACHNRNGLPVPPTPANSGASPYPEARAAGRSKKPPADVRGALALVMEVGLALANRGEGSKEGWDVGKGPALVLLLRWLCANQAWVEGLPGERTEAIAGLARSRLREERGKRVVEGENGDDWGGNGGDGTPGVVPEGVGRRELPSSAGHGLVLAGLRGFGSWEEGMGGGVDRESLGTVQEREDTRRNGEDDGEKGWKRERDMAACQYWLQALDLKKSRAAVHRIHQKSCEEEDNNSVRPADSVPEALRPPSPPSDLPARLSSLSLSHSRPMPIQRTHSTSPPLSSSAATPSSASSFSLFSSPFVALVPPTLPSQTPGLLCPVCSYAVEAERMGHQEACCECCGHVFGQRRSARPELNPASGALASEVAAAVATAAGYTQRIGTDPYAPQVTFPPRTSTSTSNGPTKAVLPPPPGLG